MRIAICDDENRILEDLSRMVLELIPDADVSSFGEGRALIDGADKEGFDVVLLDIDMPDLNGLEVAAFFQATDRKPLIIFVTSHDELVYDSLQLHPFGFVRKSYLDKELKKVLEDAVEEVYSRDKHFLFHTASGDIKLQMDDILYFEAEGNYIKIKTGSEEYRFRETMQALEMSLKSNGFIRVHKGFLVNQEAVKIINSDKLILNDNTEIPFGRSYQENARKMLMRGMLR
jgi:DNA-binding LytR/AlgR family response regulator